MEVMFKERMNVEGMFCFIVDDLVAGESKYLSMEFEPRDLVGYIDKFGWPHGLT